MKQLTPATLLIVISIGCLSMTAPHLRLYFHNNIHKAKYEAATKGKLYMVTFSAEWCTPCKFMESTAFAHTQVLDFMHKNYTAAKIDIDTKDGVIQKNIFNVTTLPTILIFNSKSQLLEKYVGSLSTTELLNLLKKHNTPDNKIKTKHASIKASSQREINYTKSSVILKDSDIPILRGRNIPKEYNHKSPKSTYQEQAADKPNNSSLLTSNEKYTIQTGVYSNLENARSEVNNLKTKFGTGTKISISRSWLAGKPVFRVFIGLFNDIESGINFKYELHRYKIDGIIKKLRN